MRTIRTKVYKFEELSESVQEKILTNKYDINVNYDWWENTYEDAANVDLKLTGFDIDRGSYCEGEFKYTAENTAKKIIAEHGDMCETYKTAKSFLEDVKMIESNTPVVFEEGTEDEYEDYSEREDLIKEREEDFLKSLCEDYLKVLRDEYEYQTSEEAVKETIIANEYEFTQDGRMI